MNNQTSSFRKKLTDFTAPNCKYWILDTDIGGDDAQALIALIHLAKKHDKIILGITCVDGNAYLKDIVVNTLIVLTQCEAKIPLYPGCGKSLMSVDFKDFYFGKDGFGNKQLDYLKEIAEKIDFSLIQKQHASEFLVEAARKHPRDLGLIVIGPMTNIALAYYLDPKIAENVEMVSVMGGNYTAFGLGRTFAAEFNFHVDAQAAYVVMKKFRNIYLSTLELAFDSSPKKIIDTFTFDSTPKGKLVKDVYHIHLKKKGAHDPLVCDPLAAFAAINTKQHIKGVYQVKCEVILLGARTKGMLAIDWLDDVSDKELCNGIVRIICDVNFDKIYDQLMESYQ